MSPINLSDNFAKGYIDIQSYTIITITKLYLGIFIFRVTIKRVSAVGFDADAEKSNKSSSDGVELATLGKGNKSKSTDVQECIIPWQEKLFSQVNQI